MSKSYNDGELIIKATTNIKRNKNAGAQASKSNALCTAHTHTHLPSVPFLPINFGQYGGNGSSSSSRRAREKKISTDIHDRLAVVNNRFSWCLCVCVFVQWW